MGYEQKIVLAVCFRQRSIGTSLRQKECGKVALFDESVEL